MCGSGWLRGDMRKGRTGQGACGYVISGWHALRGQCASERRLEKILQPGRGAAEGAGASLVMSSFTPAGRGVLPSAQPALTQVGAQGGCDGHLVPAPGQLAGLERGSGRALSEVGFRPLVRRPLPR